MSASTRPQDSAGISDTSIDGLANTPQNVTLQPITTSLAGNSVGPLSSRAIAMEADVAKEEATAASHGSRGSEFTPSPTAILSPLMFIKRILRKSPEQNDAAATKGNATKIDVPDPEKSTDSLEHLSAEQQDIIKKQTELNPDKRKVGYLDIFRFATPIELALNAVGLFAAAAAGATAPLMVIVFGRLTNNFVDFGSSEALGQTEEQIRRSFSSSLDKNALYLVYIAIGDYRKSQIQI